MNSRLKRFNELCDKMKVTHAVKDADYGSSFHFSFIEEGMAMPRIRIGDKFNRFKTLTKNPDTQKVKEESIVDTLLDMACYCIMTIVEIEDYVRTDTES